MNDKEKEIICVARDLQKTLNNNGMISLWYNNNFICVIGGYLLNTNKIKYHITSKYNEITNDLLYYTFAIIDNDNIELLSIDFNRFEIR